MEKLKLHSPDFTQENIAKLAELFPNCVTEIKDEGRRMKEEKGGGNSSFNLPPSSLRYAIDFDQLRQELSTAIVEGPQERYQLNWPGKREALLTANAPIAKTLRPCREESVGFDTTQNLFIEGDNLDALKLLQETYLNKVKMIYIDPPYNTGNDFIYEDDFAEDAESYFERSNQKDEIGNRMVANTEASGRFHSDWLSMIYPRLKLARNLLRDDGVIFISIDDNEQANLKRLCDEVFGEENFVSTIVWEKRYSPQNAVKWFSESHDFVIVFAKNKQNWHPNLLERSDEMNARYKNPDNDPRGVWKPADSTAQGGHGTITQFYELIAPNGKRHTLPNGRCWLYTEPVLRTMIADNRIWFGADGNNVPAIKRFLSEVKQGTVCQTIWKYADVGHSQEAKKEINDLFPESTVFDTPKPTRLIKRILQIATDKNDITLDFFSGSATTAHAVIQLNAEDGGKRKFIMVQIPEASDEKPEAAKAGYKTIAEIGKERIRRAGKKIKDELKGKDEGGRMKDGKTKDEGGRMKDEKGAEGSSFNLFPSSLNSDSTFNLHPSPLNLDIGFRVLKIDTSNMSDVYYAPDEVKQGDLLAQINNIREGRNEEDLLFQVLLDWGVDLSLPITREVIAGKNVFLVDGNALAACFEVGIDESFVKLLAAKHPLRAVFFDASFVSDSVKINIEQIFKLISPSTEIKTI